jgi:hypothetical protein
MYIPFFFCNRFSFSSGNRRPARPPAVRLHYAARNMFEFLSTDIIVSSFPRPLLLLLHLCHGPVTPIKMRNNVVIITRIKCTIFCSPFSDGQQNNNNTNNNMCWATMPFRRFGVRACVIIIIIIIIRIYVTRVVVAHYVLNPCIQWRNWTYNNASVKSVYGLWNAF